MAGFLSNFIRDQDLARQLGVTDWTLREWSKRGYAPARHKFGRKVYYRIADVDAFIAKAMSASAS